MRPYEQTSLGPETSNEVRELEERFNVRAIELTSSDAVVDAFSAVGVAPDGIEIMRTKAQFVACRVHSLSRPQANILKQEALSAGGDAGIDYRVLNESAASSDAVVIGSRRQLDTLCEKLRHQQFEMPALATMLLRTVENVERRKYSIGLSNGRRLELDRGRTLVMGILNVTPDSFSDGGRFFDFDAAVRQGIGMGTSGASIIDVGGESTRPEAVPVTAGEEIDRAVPVVEKLASELDIPISIDTTKSEVAEAALAAGAAIVNDISGGVFDPKILPVVARADAAYIAMHILRTPRDMQAAPEYSDLMAEVTLYLRQAIARAADAGIDRSKVIIDPGIGFGKNLGHNLTLIRRIREFASLGRPILVGVSRKSYIGSALGAGIDERLLPSLAAASAVVLRGAHIVRVHDVEETNRFLAMLTAIENGFANKERRDT